ncbi:DUF1642 domain-containing protein [Lacticaseibacillus paracasei]|uniref:DUF1642 domain-containing protein n=1 Tax=Lacticaseibacillus paracasei TaxID=1597 RepID=UPI003D7A3525
MSEEKLYAVKNDEGKYWEFGCKRNAFLDLSDVDLPVTIDEDLAFEVARNTGGHVVTFVEEPEKVVLRVEQAEIVEKARDRTYPANYISANSYTAASGEEKLLMNAYVNGYTVANEKKKKYNVKVPHTKDVWYYKSGDSYLLAICPADKKLRGKFTEAEIEHYGLQDCEKEEVTDDDD